MENTILWVQLFSYFKIAIVFICFLYTQCNYQLPENYTSCISFSAIAVGQGNASMIVIDDSALIFDTGPPEYVNAIIAEYNALGAPPVAAIFITHCDRDHAGGLKTLSEILNWTGTIIVGSIRNQDLLRRDYAPTGRDYTIMQFNTYEEIQFESVLNVYCLWPPLPMQYMFDTSSIQLNNTSLVCKIIYGTTSILITGDIDTSVTQQLTTIFGDTLRSNLLMVPHHGSRDAADIVFYSFVNPEYAIISAGINNKYGHPHKETLEYLTFCSIPFGMTGTIGTLKWLSNGFYWTGLF